MELGWTVRSWDLVGEGTQWSTERGGRRNRVGVETGWLVVVRPRAASGPPVRSCGSTDQYASATPEPAGTCGATTGAGPRSRDTGHKHPFTIDSGELW